MYKLSLRVLRTWVTQRRPLCFLIFVVLVRRWCEHFRLVFCWLGRRLGRWQRCRLGRGQRSRLGRRLGRGQRSRLRRRLGRRQRCRLGRRQGRGLRAWSEESAQASARASAEVSARASAGAWAPACGRGVAIGVGSGVGLGLRARHLRGTQGAVDGQHGLQELQGASAVEPAISNLSHKFRVKLWL